jgi:Tol biopolymer transport system component
MGRFLRALVVGLVLAGVTVVVSAPAAPEAFPGGNGLIAFESDRDGNVEIYVMGADGSNPLNLSEHPDGDYAPAWSPDGSQLAFSSWRGATGTNSELYTMVQDASVSSRVTDNDSYDDGPAWSPDGGKLAFTSLRDGNFEIYVMDLNGSIVDRLTTGPLNDWTPSWSPDGTKIAFSSNRDGAFEVYVMNDDGSGQTRLTTSMSYDWGPSWSPDGTKIAFSSYRDGNDEVYVMGSDGSDVTRLTYRPGSDFEPAWSPDGTRIAFTSARDGNAEIYVMNSDGSSQTRLTNNLATDRSPSWQPVLPPTPPSWFVGVTPARLLDTRTSLVPPGYPAGKRLAGPGTITLPVTGVGGVPVGATAVVVNVTSAAATDARSYVTVWPTGYPRPPTSSLNLEPGVNVPNLVTVKTGTDGKVSLYLNVGETHLVVDVVGYFTTDAAVGDGFTGITPLRLLDTRTAGFVPPGYPAGQPLTGPGTIRLPVACRPTWCPVGGVPEGATAALLNVTSAAATDARAFVTVWPTGLSRPPTSNLNLEPGVNVPNLVAVKLGDAGDVSLYTNIGQTHLIADVVGYYSPDSPGAFVGITPTRRLDTRTTLVPPGYPAGQPLVGPGVIDLPVVGVSGVASEATAVVANVTSTEATDLRSYVTVWPTGGSPPLASNLNLEPGVNVPNLVTVKVGIGGKVSLYTNIGQTHLIADVVGYYLTPPP